jgi:RNA polymerase sigma factor (sigma-70 family)
MTEEPTEIPYWGKESTDFPSQFRHKNGSTSLIDRMRAKDPRQLSSLGELAALEYREHLQQFLVRRIRRAQDVQDLSQEVYLRLLRVQEPGFLREPLAYLYRTAANVVYEFLRSRREHVTFDSELADRAAAKSDLPKSDEIGDQLGYERDLERVLAALPPLQQTILVLQKRDGLSYEEIALRLKLSVHTVEKYLFRALATIRSKNWDTGT